MKLFSTLALFSLVRAEFQWKPGCYAPAKPREHKEDSCNRIEQSNISRRQVERQHWATFTMDGLARVPEEKTWHCPIEAVDEKVTAEFKDENDVYTGHRTRWVVHNEASSPAVLSWVNNAGIEVSARDLKTSPPEHDGENWPNGAILPPGSFAVVEAYQGHIFYARELKADENGLPMSGRILLKHRAGLVYVRNELNAPCPQDLVDKNPANKEPPKKPASTSKSKPTRKPAVSNDSKQRKVKTTGAPPVKKKPDQNRVPKTASGNKAINKGEPKKKPPAKKPEPKGPGMDLAPACNWVHKTFINKVECAVDVFFATGSTAETTPCIYDKATAPPQCEAFTMHLGTVYNSSSHMDDWSSPIKNQETYNSHRFVVRMRHNNALVQEISVDHDIIGDCPEGKKQKVMVGNRGEAIQAEVLDPVMTLDAFPHIFNSTRQLEAANKSTHEIVLIGKNPTAPKICYTLRS